MHIDEDMRAVIAAQRLCFAATVTPEGRPGLSPKGTIRVWDETRLFFLDLASPGTRANLRANPWIELAVVDPLSRRGYRFLGTAIVHEEGPVYEEACRRIAREEGHAYEAAAVALIEVTRALPLVSPGYLHIPDETDMRRRWRERRSSLEAAFERHLEGRPDAGGARPGGGSPPA